MESKNFKTIITKLNIMVMILVLLLFLIVALGYERVCAIVYPSLLKKYNQILGDKTIEYRSQKIGPDHIIDFQFKENQKSIGEHYSLTDIKFIPDNKTLSIWYGKDKPETWNKGTTLLESMQRFRIRFKISVPDIKSLEGQTIKGTLHFSLSYPFYTNFTKKISDFHSETWNRPVSIHIYSKKELNQLSQLKNQMIKIWSICFGLIFSPILIIFIRSFCSPLMNNKLRRKY